MTREHSARRQPFPSWVFWMLAGLGVLITVLATVSLAHNLAYRRAAPCASAVGSTGCISHHDVRVAAMSVARRDSIEITFAGSPAVPAAHLSRADAARMRAGDSVRVE